MTAVRVEERLDVYGSVAAVEAAVQQVLDAEARRLTDAGPRVGLVDALRDAVAGGGKRLRPTFSHWGHVSVAGAPPAADGVVLGAALELVHTFALVHDDVMDGSDTRRGGPSVHARYAAQHDLEDLCGERRRYAEGMAILVGDLAFNLANRLVGALPAPVQEGWHDMCSELVLGQYLDLAGAATGMRSATYATRVAALKSGRYTVVRPLQLGAALAGASAATIEALSAYGEPIGEAFQLCDDLLGAFGDPAETGKPAGADIRDGKPTVLLALLVERAPAGARGLLERVGTGDLDETGVAAVLELAERTGARRQVECRIASAVDRARSAVEDPALHPAAQPALLALVERAAWRDQ